MYLANGIGGRCSSANFRIDNFVTFRAHRVSDHGQFNRIQERACCSGCIVKNKCDFTRTLINSLLNSAVPYPVAVTVESTKVFVTSDHLGNLTTLM